ncbi:sensor histidine kinase [Propionivibrio sp.]|uniref:sensor histidine kinase n=1 Tax=Propionivibrio sp. TaxID=2212460 RepID=UPI0039E486AE
MNSIRRNLLKWQIGALLATGLLASLITYALAWNAFNQMRNDGLVQIAYSIVRHGLVENEGDGAEEEDASDKGQFVSQIWGDDGELVYTSLDNGGPPRQKPGHHTLSWRGETWHVYTLEDGGVTIQVSNSAARHYPLFRNIGPWLLLPLTLMTAVLGGLIWLAVGRALRPLDKVRAEIMGQAVPSLRTMETRDLPTEVAPLGEALNALLQRLEQAFATERDFIANAAHELRTPLTAVRLQAQLADQARDAAQRAAALDQLRAGVDRAAHVVEQLLQMARLEPDAQQFTFAEVRLDQLAKNAVADFSPQAEDRRIDLGVGTCRPVRLSGHAESLRILLSNLIENALRHTPAGGRIDVDVDEEDGLARLDVADSGPGIPEEFRERVFDRFFRLAGSDTPGSGLGLPIARQAARLHGGEITLGESPAGGLRVRVALPTQAAGPAAPR